MRELILYWLLGLWHGFVWFVRFVAVVDTGWVFVIGELVCVLGYYVGLRSCLLCSGPLQIFGGGAVWGMSCIVVADAFETLFGRAGCTVVRNLSTQIYSVGLRNVSSERRLERSV